METENREHRQRDETGKTALNRQKRFRARHSRFTRSIRNSVLAACLILLACMFASKVRAQPVPETQPRPECPQRVDRAWAERRGSPLLQAVRNLDMDKTTALLKAGADVRETDSYGRPPLLLAFRRFSWEPPGGKISVGMTKQQTRRESKNQIRMLKLLLDHNADVNQKGSGGVTALHSAIEQPIFSIQNTKQVILMLLSKGADINAEDDYGMTPLMLAAQFDLIEIVHFLLQKGANSELINCYGESALLMAKKRIK